MDESTGKRDHKVLSTNAMLDKEEKEFLENDSCLEKVSDEPKPEPPTFKEKLRQKCRCTTLTRTGLILVILLSILLVVFFVVIVVLAVKLANYDNFASKICKSPNCLRVSANILDWLNASSEPCRDFYQFSCGRWNEKEIDGYGLASGGRETRLGAHLRQFRATLLELLNTLTYVANKVNSIEWKMKSFYDSCMNVDNIEAADTHPVIRIINQLHGWNVLGDWVSSLWDTNQVLREMQVNYGVFPFFQADVQMDDETEKMFVQIKPGQLGLPHKSYYFRSHHDKIVESYKRMMYDLAVHLGATGRNAKTFADDIFYFERRIAEITPESEYRSKLRYKQQFHSVGELMTWSPQIMWLDYLNSLFPSYQIQVSTKVAANKTYLREISRIISSADSGILNNYVMWCLVHRFAPYLSKKFRVVLDNFNHALTGSTREVSRWEFCIGEVEKMFPLGVNALYIKHHIPDRVFQSVESYYKEIKETLIERISEYHWMDWQSKENTRQKVKLLKLQLKPAINLNKTFVDEQYLSLTILKSDFFQNILKGVYFRTNKAVDALKRQSDWYYKSFKNLPITPYVSLSRKNLIVPVYLIKSPIFDEHQLGSLNFGSLGWLIARALLQGFEDVDVYDKEWMYQQNEFDITHFRPRWWSNYTLERYSHHQRCIAEEYSKYELEDIKIPGNTTEDENMADVGSLIIAHKAFRNWLSKRSEEQLLPSLQYYSPDQLFFISFAQTLCTEAKTEAIEYNIQSRKFSPNKIRIQGSVSRNPEFAYAFDCSYYDPMNLPDKCATW